MHGALAIALGVTLAAAAAPGETFLLQSGQDSSPYAFFPDQPRGVQVGSAYAFTATDVRGRDHSFEFYIQWNLPPPLLLPGVEVEQALAWVYHGFAFAWPGERDLSDEVGELLCHEVLAGWSDTSLSWNHRPPIDNYFDASFDILNQGLYWCDVTDLVRQWIADPSTNHGIALTSSRQRVMGFYTFDSFGVSPNFKPSLMVKTLPEPAAAASLTAGCALLLGLRRRRGDNACARS